MTNQNIPADLTPEEVEAAREWATSYLNGFYKPGHVDAAARALTALLPAPTLPTLADMTPEDRDACRWMQADTKLWGRVVIVLHNAGGGRAVTLNREGHMAYEDHGTVTPRPDLPRMEWPSNQKAAPAPALPDGWLLADHQKHGRVIVTNTTPNRDGRFYYVLPVAVVPHADHSQGAFRNRMGFDWRTCDPAELTYIDTDQ